MSTYRGEKNAYRVLMGKRKGSMAFGRHVRNWKILVKINLKEMGLEEVDWIHLVLDKRG